MIKRRGGGNRSAAAKKGWQTRRRGGSATNTGTGKTARTVARAAATARDNSKMSARVTTRNNRSENRLHAALGAKRPVSSGQQYAGMAQSKRKTAANFELTRRSALRAGSRRGGSGR